MKKRNEDGYVLVYVMVVVFVLCAIALALMSNTLRTLQAQEAMVQRMTDKYEAMGEIERVVAEIKSYTETHTTEGSPLISDTNVADNCSASHSLHDTTDFNDTVIGFKNEHLDIQIDEDDPCLYYIIASPEGGSVEVNATIRITPHIDSNCLDHVSGPTENKYTHIMKHKYTVSISDIAFTSYQISSVEGGDSDA